MKLTSRLNDKILKIIKYNSYISYYIERDIEKKCTCISHSTKQADIRCQLCLGTGYKITIRKIIAASQDTKMPPTFKNSNFAVSRNFYITSKNLKPKEGDIIMSKDAPYIILDYQEMFSLEGEIPYRKVVGVKKKYDSEIFIENFNKLFDKKR